MLWGRVAIGFAVVILSVSAVFEGSNVYSVNVWQSHEYQEQECKVAAEIASEIVRSHELGEHANHLPVFSFWPQTLSPQDSLTFRQGGLFAGNILRQPPGLTAAALRFKYAQPESLDCKQQFRAHLCQSGH